MKKIKPENFHEPVGHYSPAVVSNGLVFVSGQLAVDPVSGAATGGSAGEQTERCLANVDLVLRAAGSDLSRTVKMTLFVSSEDLWGEVNEAYKKVFGDHRPARAIIPVRDFREPFLVEVEAIAETDLEG